MTRRARIVIAVVDGIDAVLDFLIDDCWNNTKSWVTNHKSSFVVQPHVRPSLGLLLDGSTKRYFIAEAHVLFFTARWEVWTWS